MNTRSKLYGSALYIVTKTQTTHIPDGSVVLVAAARQKHAVRTQTQAGVKRIESRAGETGHM